MPRTRVQPGDPFRIGSRDWNDVLNLLDNQRGKDAKGGLGRKLIKIPAGTWESQTAKICTIRKIYGNVLDGEIVTFLTDPDDKLLVVHPGPTDIDGGSGGLIGLAEVIEGGYWVLSSVYC